MHIRNTFDPRRFSLIELLVVIVIIMILAALLLPALQRARGMASSTSCMGNLRQIYTALMMYEEDYTRWPAPSDWSGWSGGHYPTACHWFAGLGPYAGFPQWRYGVANSFKNSAPVDNIFRCPDARREDMLNLPGYVSNVFGYGMQGFLPPVPATLPHSQALSYPDPKLFAHPQLLRVIVDCRSTETGSAAELSYPSMPARYFRFDRIRHVSQSRTNLLFADGHARSATFSATEQAYLALGNDYWREHDND
ncbi:MAG: DUF1559 domain-containing protein [Lentisphaerae bacterium]|nr:MAG: DUF1559 domain-containing protein [Lentisphaerota bacterium]